jgi:DNA-binding response OmpR family regulator
MYKILIVEDDVNLGIPLMGALEMQGYKVLYLTNGDQIIEEFLKFEPDIVILDIILNGLLDGFEIAKLIRKMKNTPIIFTTSRNGNEDFKVGLSIENTDYVRKPYSLMEILMRISNLLSRQISSVKYNNNRFQIGHFYFSPEEQSLKYEYEEIHLNNHESAVLGLLCNNTGTYISRGKIIEQVWHEQDAKLKEGSLNNILTNIRRYLNRDNRIVLERKIGLGVKLILNENIK